MYKNINEIFNNYTKRNRILINKRIKNDKEYKDIIHKHVLLEKQKMENNYKNNEFVKYKLGNLNFKTKLDRQKFISKWLSISYYGYIPIEEQLIWINDLISKHPKWEEYKNNINYINIKYNKRYNYFYFNLVNKNRTHQSISYRLCLNNNLYNNISSIKKAFRDEIQYQIKHYRKKVFRYNKTIICPCSGIVLKNDELTHIDHNFDEGKTFNVILNDFLKEQNIILDKIKIYTGKKNKKKYLFNKILSNNWKKFHRKSCILRAIYCKNNIRGK